MRYPTLFLESYMSAHSAPLSLKVPPEVASRLSELRAKSTRCIVAIDGRGGAGKSTLARLITATICNARHVELDWFHLPHKEVTHHNRIEVARLRDELLLPFTAGQRDFEFRRYNWGYLAGIPDGFAPEPVRLNQADFLVLEGCGALHPQLKDFYHLTIWVDTDAQEALRRGTRRDIEQYGLDPHAVEQAWAEWTQWEDESLRTFNRRQLADVIV